MNARASFASILLSFALACTAKDEPAPEARTNDTAEAQGPCETLSAGRCMAAPHCVLEAPPSKNDSSYVCRPAQPPCEGGVAQRDPAFEADCRARAEKGCTFEPASCFCPNARTRVTPIAGSEDEKWSRVDCACGGGPPRRCVAK